VYYAERPDNGAKIMATENLNKAGEIFQNAIEIENPEERASYIENACKNDTKLRAKVDTLLKAHEQAGDYLEAPAIGTDVTLNSPVQIEGPGMKIGRYELLSLIDEGGIGLVYLAEQNEPVKRRVALKIIKPGMDSRQVVVRFEAERQALAPLDHPNIAHVFDAGTTETGRPYFVMEYIKGLSITAFCDQNKLNIEQRLRLFEQVCEAIHHAHQKGITHRDIKPSNILVSVHGDKAVPKIIGFGIAKAIRYPLTDKTLVTFQGQLLGTPAYMSPEQVDLEVQEIDTCSDIYSLGVVLYELLAGVLPFEREWLAHLSFSEVQRTIREQEPASPSIRLSNLGQEARIIAARRGTQVIALARRLHRELEWIPLKAMRKDRCRRYKSASELADDVRNYLNGNPLIAGPETAIYRVKKFVRRHVGFVATVTLTVGVIIIALVVNTSMYFRAKRTCVQAEQAEKVAQDQRSMADEQRQLAEQKAEEYRRSLYCNSIALADASCRDGNTDRIRRLLDSCPTDLRGWEWDHLNYISDQSIRTIQDVNLASSNWLCSFVLSPDGSHFACPVNNDIKIWNTATGTERITLRGHKRYVIAIAYSPDGKRIASGGQDKTIKIWNVITGNELMTLRGHKSKVTSVSFSPDGKKIVSGSGDGTVKLWDAKNATELFTMRGHQDRISSVAFSPDGKWIASSGGLDTMIKIWNASTGSGVTTLVGDKKWVYPVVFSPDSSCVAFGGLDKVVRIWDLTRQSEKAVMKGHTGIIEALVFTPDGKRIVSSSSDGTIKIWDTAIGNPIMTLKGHTGSVVSVRLSPTTEEIYSAGSEGTIKVWDLSIDREQLAFEEHIPLSRLVFSPDNMRIAAAVQRGGIMLWDISSGAEVMNLKTQWKDRPSIAFSPDGRQIACGNCGRNGDKIEIWSVASGVKTMTLWGHAGSVYCVTFSPDGKFIASLSDNSELRMWDARSGVGLLKVLWQGNSFPDLPDRRVISMAFSRDGKWIIAPAYDDTVRIWDSSTGEQVMILRGHKSFVKAIAVSPDGRRIASCSFDKTVRVWDIGTGTELLTLEGHRDVIQDVSFSPDGKRIVSCGNDGAVKIWDAYNGAEVMHRERPAELRSVGFSADGKILAACGSDSIILWESNPPASGYMLRKAGTTARKLVDELYVKHGSYHSVIAKLLVNRLPDELVLNLALQIANSRKWEDADKLTRETWKAVNSDDKSTEEYRAASERASKANSLKPNNPVILNTLGEDQYRVGSY
jgi:WD40 repeat protein/serine/threonine protein kinase